MGLPYLVYPDVFSQPAYGKYAESTVGFMIFEFLLFLLADWDSIVHCAMDISITEVYNLESETRNASYHFGELVASYQPICLLS